MATGNSGQSPIDICDYTDSPGPRLRFDYGGEAIAIEHHDLAPLVRCDAANRLWIGERDLELIQFHWHTPAEHTLDGEGAAMELHLVHRDSADQLAVVAVRYQLGAADAAIQRLIEATPERGTSVDSGLGLSVADYAPASSGHYHYVGSLTAPPYTEPVEWYVIDTQPTISAEQADALQGLTDGPNARCLQDRNGRRIVRAP